MIKPIGILKGSCSKKYLREKLRDKFLKYIKWGLIEWTDEPRLWHGPFDGKYAFFKVVEYPMYRLNGKTEIFVHLENAAKYNRSNLPLHLRKGKCSDALTHQEFLAFERKLIYGLDYVEWKKNIADNFQQRLKGETWLSIEHPFYIHMCGNDDDSYGLAVSTKAEALSIIERLSNNPTWELFRSFGFKYTN